MGKGPFSSLKALLRHFDSFYYWERGERPFLPYFWLILLFLANFSCLSGSFSSLKALPLDFDSFDSFNSWERAKSVKKAHSSLYYSIFIVLIVSTLGKERTEPERFILLFIILYYCILKVLIVSTLGKGPILLSEGFVTAF